MLSSLSLMRRFFGCLRYLTKKLQCMTNLLTETKLKTLYLLLQRGNELLSEQNRIITVLISVVQDESEKFHAPSFNNEQ